MTAGEWVDLILARAHELRAAGVAMISFDGAAVHLAPPEPTPPQLERVEGRAPILDALNDPATFGGVLPGYRIPDPHDYSDEVLP